MEWPQQQRGCCAAVRLSNKPQTMFICFPAPKFKVLHTKEGTARRSLSGRVVQRWTSPRDPSPCYSVLWRPGSRERTRERAWCREDVGGSCFWPLQRVNNVEDNRQWAFAVSACCGPY